MSKPHQQAGTGLFPIQAVFWSRVAVSGDSLCWLGELGKLVTML